MSFKFYPQVRYNCPRFIKEEIKAVDVMELSQRPEPARGSGKQVEAGLVRGLASDTSRAM